MTSRQLFVNLPVADLQRSVALFTALGFTFNEQFTDDSATCMVIGEGAYAMLLTEQRFKDFTPKTVADAHGSTEAIVSVSAESREEVDRLADTALAHGARQANQPMDMEFMYGRSFFDPDGHLWELFWMDPTSMPS